MGWETYINDLDIPKNWECTSYGNDELPSYQVNGFHIWIDSHDLQERIQNTKNIFGDDIWILEEREIVNGIDVTGDNLSPRFTIQYADNYNGVIDNDVTLLSLTLQWMKVDALKLTLLNITVLRLVMI
mgnify:CR=1 FL=1